MDQLTLRERNALDNISMARDRLVRLGDIIFRIIAQGQPIQEGTPVNVTSATGTLTISGVVIDGETVTIGSDIYEFVSDTEESVTDIGNIPVSILANAAKSTGALTMDTQPIAGDTVTIGAKTYIFVPAGTDTADGEVSIGTSLAEAQEAFVAAVNGLDAFNEYHPQVKASAFVADVCTITARAAGKAGDTIVTTEAFTAATNVFAAVKLGSGADCSATNAVAALVLAVTANDTMGVTAVDGAGDTVVFSSPGTPANTIGVSAAMANGAFPADVIRLSGGLDGTVAPAGTILADESYIYLCLAGNTAEQANWRRVSVGVAY